MADLDTTRVRERRVAARSWWADSLVGAIWLVTAAALSLLMLGGGLLASSPIDYVYSAGRAMGIVAAILVMTQVALMSRAPWIEQAFGHDRTAKLHTTLGKYAFLAMLVHFSLITAMTANYDGVSIFAQPIAFADIGWHMVAALVGLALFALVVATSLWAVRSRWKYENWHAVHILVYIAIAAVVPHQFLEGSTFREWGFAGWFWLALYVVSFGSFIVYRLARPLVHLSRHGLRVSEVVELPDGSTSIVMTGKHLDRLRARPGQFFLWRFLAKGHWREAHPFSLSSGPRPDSLRITVKPAGDWTRRAREIQVGTKVIAEGPLGVYSQVSRSRPGLVLVSAGIGITPHRSMLEAHRPEDGPCTVIVRARSAADAPLLDEMRELAAAQGATLHVLFGGRGDGWAPAGQDTTLAQLVPGVADCDIYICGPDAWARQVAADAMAAGCDRAAIHREEFAWDKGKR